MASIKTRGPKNARRFYVGYDIGRTADGKRVQRMHLLKGVEDMRQARQELARVERDLAAGKDPFAEVLAPEAIKPLLERWRDSLTNRNADDDRDIRDDRARRTGEDRGFTARRGTGQEAHRERGSAFRSQGPPRSGRLRVQLLKRRDRPRRRRRDWINPGCS